MKSVSISQTIILAAGNGSRLGSRASGVPKPLVPVGGRPLIAHALDHARDSGCVEAVIVTGYAGDRVRQAVESLQSALRIRFVHNPNSAVPNGVSLLAAAPVAAPQFFLQMVDHVFAAAALPKLVAAPLGADEDGRVLVDRDPREIDLDDATRVRLAGSRVSAIGKGITPWDAIDAGCFLLSRAIFEALRQVPEEASRTVSSGMRRFVEQGRLGTADLDGLSWVDVDTPADHEIAERLLQPRR